MSELVLSIKQSNRIRALDILDKRLGTSTDALALHNEIFPVAQLVLNPPFINPHFPKMYRIFRELFDYLEPGEVTDLVRVEVSEYAQRMKLEEFPRSKDLSHASDDELRDAIRRYDRELVANMLLYIKFKEGNAGLSRRLLKIGSGYLNSSLGHSISCTAFMLLELANWNVSDSWPAISMLSEFFCKGGFADTPENLAGGASPSMVDDNILRAVSGTGIVNLHDTITIYSAERSQSPVDEELHNHLLGSWLQYLDDKEPVPFKVDGVNAVKIDDYDAFFNLFANKETERLVASSMLMLPSEVGRRRLGRFIIKGLCDSYQSRYNPHVFTGLGSLMWVLNRFRMTPLVPETALYQYLNYCLSEIKL